MYERNAIVIDRYFSDMFGYGEKNNLKNNYKNYCELVNNLEKYQIASEAEDNMMIEFEKTASEIKETQKVQEALNKRNAKLQESRKSLFDNLDEDSDMLKKRFDKIEEELNRNNEDIKNNEQRFIFQIAEFHEKSNSRTQCGRERRIIENEYQKNLSETIENFNNNNQDKIKEAKDFLRQESSDDVKKDIQTEILKNGEKEKVKFDEDVIVKAIDIATDIEEKKLEILVSSYEKTLRLLTEIKNDAVKIDKHKKYVKDSESKLKFLNSVGEYIVLFLDNERMNVMGGEKEHKKVMAEACNNLDQDLEQIKNMYNLLVKEIASKSTKKAYKELYHPEYLIDLQEDEKEFEKNVSKLNMIGTVIYPNYWRIEGMQKIYDTFKNLIIDVYEKDLTEFEPTTIDEQEDEEVNLDSNEMYIDDKWDEEFEEEDNFELDDDDSVLDEFDFGDDDDDYDEEFDEKDDEEFDDELDLDEDEFDFDEEEVEEEKESSEEKRDKEIDEILGFFDGKKDKEDDDETEEEDFSYDDIDFDIEDEEEIDEDDENEDLQEIESNDEESNSENKKLKNISAKDYIEDVWNEDEDKKVDKKKKKSFFGKNKN